VTSRFVLVAITFLLLPTPSGAMTFSPFDKMSIYAQAEYVAVMVEATVNALSAEGQAELATRVDQLFREIKPGDKIPVGIGALEQFIARARVADLRRVEKDPKADRLEVEHALFVALENQETPIKLPRNVTMRVFDAMENFHMQTYAEFLAKSAEEQRRAIRLLVGIAFPDYYIREVVESKRETFLGLGEESLQDLAQMMRTQFPQSGQQPGFVEVARRIGVEHKKGPNRPNVFLEVTIYILNQIEAKLDEREKALDKNAITLPRRR
jgi:hypothetical protein